MIQVEAWVKEALDLRKLEVLRRRLAEIENAPDEKFRSDSQRWETIALVLQEMGHLYAREGRRFLELEEAVSAIPSWGMSAAEAGEVLFPLLMAHSEMSGSIPFEDRDLSSIINLDSDQRIQIVETSMAWAQQNRGGLSDRALMFLGNHDHYRLLDQKAEGAYVDLLEKRANQAKTKEWITLAWRVYEEHYGEFMPIDAKLLAEVAPEVFPEITIKTVYYDIMSNWEEWLDNEGGTENLDLSEFVTRYEDFAWHTSNSNYSSSPKDLSLFREDSSDLTEQEIKDEIEVGHLSEEDLEEHGGSITRATRTYVKLEEPDYIVKWLICNYNRPRWWRDCPTED